MISMNGTLALVQLILAAALPVLAAFIWFKARCTPITLPWFLLFLVTGMLSLLLAARLQQLLPLLSRATGGLSVFLNMLARIALLEELSRLVILFPISRLIDRGRSRDLAFYTSLGLVSGLGFAMLENALYGLANINITLLRSLTAAPLHGACATRVAAGLYFRKEQPVRALFSFLTAVFIHAAYNMTIAGAVFHSGFALLIALTALLSIVPYLRFPEGTGR